MAWEEGVGPKLEAHRCQEGVELQVAWEVGVGQAHQCQEEVEQ